MRLFILIAGLLGLCLLILLVRHGNEEDRRLRENERAVADAMGSLEGQYQQFLKAAEKASKTADIGESHRAFLEQRSRLELQCERTESVVSTGPTTTRQARLQRIGAIRNSIEDTSKAVAAAREALFNREAP
jgi:hypothetical protein